MAGDFCLRGRMLIEYITEKSIPRAAPHGLLFGRHFGIVILDRRLGLWSYSGLGIFAATGCISGRFRLSHHRFRLCGNGLFSHSILHSQRERVPKKRMSLQVCSQHVSGVATLGIDVLYRTEFGCCHTARLAALPSRCSFIKLESVRQYRSQVRSYSPYSRLRQTHSPGRVFDFVDLLCLRLACANDAIATHPTMMPKTKRFNSSYFP